MPPRRPPPSSRAGTGRPDGAPAERRPKPAASGRASRPAPEEEDWSAPESEEGGSDEARPELYGEDDSQRSLTGETRVASVEVLREEASNSSEDEDDNSEATRAGPPVLVESLEGPDKGRKKRFQGVRLVVGRGKDCDFVLTDQSVSRRHLEFVYGEKGVVMRDLGSVSGTKVNDQRVDECLLKHGDEIAVGKTRLRFVDEAEQIKELRAKADSEKESAPKEKPAPAKEGARSSGAARGSDVDPNDPRFNEATNANYKLSDLMRPGAQPQGSSPGPSKSRPPARSVSRTPQGMDPKMKLFAIGGGVVVLLLVMGLVFAKKDPPPPPPPDPKIAKSTQLMQRARESVRGGEFADAVRFVEEAEKLNPGVDVDGLGKAARKQQAVAEALEQARALIAENKFEEARAKLAAAPQGTAKSDEEKTKLETELQEKEGQFLVSQADAALASRDPEAVRPLLEKLPENARPIYQQKLTDLEAELAKEATDAARQTRIRNANAADSAKRRREELVAEAFIDVERRFNGGDFQRAVLECDRVVDKNKADKDIRDRARDLKRLIPLFKTAFEDGQRKYQSGALEAAVKPLRRAAELYRQIGFSGSLVNSIDEQLASASVSAGQAALKRGDLGAASTHFREALRLNPGDSRARDGLSTLQKRVEELFLQAYIQRDRDPQAATEKFKIVIEASAEDADVKRKAEMYLGEMQPKSGE
ncbi:FHA domain-containing protein [Myxococcaceae bacterium JPH2]|nr:FHA domain-containing protein [Myxococcaceae bacterium JPH2]